MEKDNAIGLVIVVALIALVIGAPFVLYPNYNVWAKRKGGEANLAEAESTRRVAVLEAQAKADSAEKLAEAEVKRASGVAEANKIIGASLRDNPEYLQWLYIQNLENGSNNGNTVIYVPTENGLPVPVLSYDRNEKK
jgi:regulator of protease activity HflC (stomatin/prohibitin superfamily)